MPLGVLKLEVDRFMDGRVTTDHARSTRLVTVIAVVVRVHLSGCRQNTAKPGDLNLAALIYNMLEYLRSKLQPNRPKNARLPQVFLHNVKHT